MLYNKLCDFSKTIVEMFARICKCNRAYVHQAANAQWHMCCFAYSMFNGYSFRDRFDCNSDIRMQDAGNFLCVSVQSKGK